MNVFMSYKFCTKNLTLDDNDNDNENEKENDNENENENDNENENKQKKIFLIIYKNGLLSITITITKQRSYKKRQDIVIETYQRKKITKFKSIKKN